MGHRQLTRGVLDDAAVDERAGVDDGARGAAGDGARPADGEQSGRDSPEGATPSTRRGPGRLLVAVYAVFALSATARAVFQIATQFAEAPVAYLLSAFAGLVYIVAPSGSPGGAVPRDGWPRCRARSSSPGWWRSAC